MNRPAARSLLGAARVRGGASGMIEIARRQTVIDIPFGSDAPATAPPAGEVVLRVDGDTLVGADLSGLSLRCADLRDADLSRADLSRADLSSADLRGACLAGADLTGANLTIADLTSA